MAVENVYGIKQRNVNFVTVKLSSEILLYLVGIAKKVR